MCEGGDMARSRDMGSEVKNWETWEGSEVARWERWKSSGLARWEVPRFVQGSGTQGGSKILSFSFS